MARIWMRGVWVAALSSGVAFSVSCTREVGTASSSMRPRPATAIEMAEIAMFDAGLAAALADKPAVHRPGTVVTLEYTAVGEDGGSLRRWQVRTLTLDAALISLEPEVWEASVPDIEAKLRSEGATVLRETGSPGLPAEAVKRMPIGEMFEFAIADEPFVTTHLDGSQERVDARPYVDGRVSRPSVPLRVRVVTSCQADVRIERDRKIEFAQFAILPVPTGVRERRWVQMKGCPAPASRS